MSQHIFDSGDEDTADDSDDDHDEDLYSDIDHDELSPPTQEPILGLLCIISCYIYYSIMHTKK